MPKITKIWSFENEVRVELEDGYGYSFPKGKVNTKADLLQAVKNIRIRESEIEETKGKGRIDNALKHLKELEGAEV